MSERGLPFTREVPHVRRPLCNAQPLGQSAVFGAEHAAQLILNDEAPEETDCSVELNTLRDRMDEYLASGTPDDKASRELLQSRFLNHYAGQLPGMLADATESDEHILQRLRYLPDGTLLNFLQWNDHQRELRQQQLEACLPGLIEGASELTTWLVKCGLFPPHAVEVMQESLKGVKTFYAFDVFEASEKFIRGSYNRPRFRMGLWLRDGGQLGYLEPDEGKTFFHEALHAAENGQGERGLFSILPEDKHDLRWFGEAFIEHAALAAYRGDHQTVYPDYLKDIGSYTLERELLAAVLDEGERTIDTALLGEAFFEPNTAGTLRSRRELDEQLRWSFKDAFPEHNGENIVRIVAREYNQVSTSKREEVLGRWLQKIYKRCGRGAFIADFRETPEDRPLISLAPL